jgi:hypothetical protein
MEEDYNDLRQLNKSLDSIHHQILPASLFFVARQQPILSSQLTGISIIYIHTCNSMDSIYPNQESGCVVFISRLYPLNSADSSE